MNDSQPSPAEQEFRAMQTQWEGIPYLMRVRLAEAVGSNAAGEVAGDHRLLRQALAIWDKEKP